MRKLYIDTCLIIAYFHQGDPKNQHKRAIDFFNCANDTNTIQLYCSSFTITEFTQAYVTLPHINDEQAHKIANSLLLTRKIDKKHSFDLLETQGGEKNYKFEDFFLDIQTVVLNTTPRPGIADAIHATIMNNNEIDEIVTFNIKDFINIDDINPLEPETII